MLDASAAGLMLPMLTEPVDYVQTSENLAVQEGIQDGVDLPTRNTPPSGLQLFATDDDLFENDVTQLFGIFVDPDIQDTHVVQIDWDDGSPLETITLDSGARFFSTSHQYLDDNPTSDPVDINSITVTLIDNSGDMTSACLPITVRNIDPSNIQVEPLGMIDENGTVKLQLTFDDPGTQDTHSVEIDWDGDGTFDETFDLSVGVRSLSTTHQYLDDDPTDMPTDLTMVKIKVLDDDGGMAMTTAPITVKNVSPKIESLAITSPVLEDGVATLSGTYSDPGSWDTFELDIDWDGNGTYDETVAISGGKFSVMHQYLDDIPTNTSTDTFDVNVRLRDDDMGSDTGSVELTVENVPPTISFVLQDQRIKNEGDTVNLNVEFVDPGTLDTHDYEVDWGDGIVTNGVIAGRGFTASHVYADNGNYVAEVRVLDDDKGLGKQTVKIPVNNVAPTLTATTKQVVNEGTELSLTNIATFTDPGFDNPLNTLDSGNGSETEEFFTFEINWGDGTTVSTGSATVDVFGSPGVLTEGSFDGSHTYADDGDYVVTLKVMDDDLGSASAKFGVTVNNVQPELTGEVGPLNVNEGEGFDLFGLGVGLTDPGFDNLDNPIPGGELQETFTGISVDWGDGTALENTLSIVNRASGSPGTPTTADFSHPQHVYADDGEYTVTVKFQDDDGAPVSQSFTIVVHNVAPTLVLTGDAQVVDEGSPLVIGNLGTFTDPGFNNSLNTLDPGNGEETQEYFTYEIDWDDGTVETGQIPTSTVSGSPGVLTTGTIADSHTYLDNDDDNLYTVTITLSDDDGGFDIKSIVVFVTNVNPALMPIAATDLESGGTTFLTMEFADPGTESLTVLVDWGDKLHLPPADRFVASTVVVGPGTQNLILAHTYSGPPDPLHPAADIEIRVMIRDDDFDLFGIVVADGESNLETVTITNPGEGTDPVRIDTTPQVPQLVFPRHITTDQFLQESTGASETLQTSDIRAASGETKATTDRYLVLQAIYPDGGVSEDYRLQPEVLNNLPDLFARLPEYQYVIYVVREETNTRRVVIEVFSRNGRLIDPGDDFEGARDRPPIDEATRQPVEAIDDPDDADETEDQATPSARNHQPEPNTPQQELLRAVDQPLPPGTQAESGSPMTSYLDSGENASDTSGSIDRSRLTLAIAGVAATSVAESWASQVDRAVSQASPLKWRLLRRRNHSHRKNRP